MVTGEELVCMVQWYTSRSSLTRQL